MFSTLYCFSLLLDYFLGDPPWLPHPVRLIGLFCQRVEQWSRMVVRSQRLAGLVAVILVLLLFLLPLGLVLYLCNRYLPALELVIAVYLLYSAVAYRDLQHHALRVMTALTSGQPDSLAAARRELAKIVGRDTDQLPDEQVSKATVETVAENFVDGIASPLIYGIVVSLLPLGEGLSSLSLAALGAYTYKCINTMDSMYGYKNDRYLQFGTVAARLDDVANFLPARLGGVLLVMAAWLLRLDGRGALTVFLRDRLAHASPNGGHPEAAVAGALGIQLGGPTPYFGVLLDKPTIGNAERPTTAADIATVCRMTLVASILLALLLLVARALIVGTL